MTKTILLRCEGQVAYLTFNRPEKMNAFNRQMTHELDEAIDKIRHAPFVRVVVMRGAGEVFMSGSDIEEFSYEMTSFSADALAVIRCFNSSILALKELDKPVVAIVHGLVTGCGISLMLAADLVLAEEHTKFFLGFCKIGLSPAGGVSYSLPRLVGAKKAAELLLLSETFDAPTARQLGLVNWVMPKSEVERQANTILEQLINGPTVALTQTKQLLNSAWQNKVTSQLELEAESFLKSVHSKDFKMAVRAFVSKRQPEFEGR